MTWLWEFFSDLFGNFVYWLETRRHGPVFFLVRAEEHDDLLFLDYDQAMARARELAATGYSTTVHSHWRDITSQPTASFAKPAPLGTPRRRPSALAERVLV